MIVECYGKGQPRRYLQPHLIAVFALGYGNKDYNDALKSQIDKVIHTSNYYYNMPAIRAAKKLKEEIGRAHV